MENTLTFCSVGYVADRLGVPVAWLQSEAEAGRVPVIRAGRRLLMDLDAVRQSLVRHSVESCTASREGVPSRDPRRAYNNVLVVTLSRPPHPDMPARSD